jgi:hypothetical protein
MCEDDRRKKGIVAFSDGGMIGSEEGNRARRQRTCVRLLYNRECM